MVWLAASGSTAVLGYFLYKYYLLPTKSQSSEAKPNATIKQSDESDPETNFTFNSEGVPADGLTDSLSPLTDAKNLLKDDTERADTLAQPPPAIPSIIPPPASTMSPPSLRASSPPRLKPPTFGNMPAPPRPNNTAPLRPPPSAAASLRVPTTKVLSNISMAPKSSAMPQSKKSSRQVMLQPGHSPIDWAILTKSPNHNLRGKDVPGNLIRVSPSQLRSQNGRKGRDAWSVYQGKVYNITPYLHFHPGGEGELMRGAGKDAANLFMEVHPWVNWENMLGECLVGILVGEGEEKDKTGTSGGLDEMD